MKSVKNLFLLLILVTYNSFSQSTSLTTIYSEEFNKIGNWPSGNNSNRELSVKDGKYFFEYKKPEKSWRVSTGTINLDTSKDFELETSIEKISGVDNYGITFMYDFKDDKNYRELGFTSGGYFRVAESENGTYKNTKEWTKSDKIKTGNYSVNILKVAKKNNKITFYINGSYVYSMSYKTFIGKKMAITVYRSQKIAIDYIRAKQVTKKTNNYSKTVMYDSFYSNRNNWAITDKEQVKLEIKNSKYYFDYKEKKGWTSTNVVNLNDKRDFKIEAAIQKISGIQNNGYGIIFGRKDKDNQHQFVITSNGNFSIDKYDNGKLTTLVNWKKSSFIKKDNNAINKLKIEKRGNSYDFFINNYRVHTESYLKYYGKRVGFSIFDTQKIAIDYLSISYLDNKPNDTNIFKDDSKSKRDVIFVDNFNDNNPNEWISRDDKDTRFRLFNGKYYIEHKRKTKGWSSNISKEFDSSKEFEIVTKIHKIKGVTNNAYGLIWGQKDNNSFRFYITATGYYKIVRIVDGKEQVILKWKKSSTINKGNGVSNILKIKKESDYYKFYINDRYVDKIDFEPFYGHRIGYVVYNEQEIAIDYLKINSLKKSKNTNIVSNKTLTLPLIESFSSNTNGWQMEDSEDYSAALVNGELMLHKKKKGGIFISRSVDINSSKDFIIETSLKKINESNQGLYGITFGRKNSSNEYTFLLSNNGSYMYRKFDNDKYKKIIPFTESSAINKGINKANKIKIVKSGELLRFYINGQYVNEAPFEPFFGNKFGYTIYHDKKIAVDYLDIKYQTNKHNNPPTVVITSPNVEAKRGFKIVQTKRIQVRGKATDSDGIFEITVNGVEANVSEDGTFLANVPLKYGKNTLIVKAVDLKEASSTKKFTIKRKSKNTDNTIIVDNNKEKLDIGFGKYHALIIGVSTYKDKTIADLNGEPTKDAQALADLLISKYNFDSKNVTVLKNPTENQIIKEFYNLRKKVGNNDNVVIFYAGHGNYDQASEKGYWMPSDAEMEFEGNVILNTSIVSYIKSINSKHTLLIADACFSGSILSTSRSYNKASNAVKTKYSLPSRRAITSGTLTTVPNKSVFMKYLLKRLTQNNKTYLSAGQLFNMIEDPVINNTSGNNKPQYAPISRTGDEGGDFIFIKNN